MATGLVCCRGSWLMAHHWLGNTKPANVPFILSCRVALYGMSFTSRATKAIVEGIIGGMGSDEGNLYTAGMATVMAGGSAGAGAVVQAVKHGYDLGSSFVGSLVPQDIVRDLPPLGAVLDGPIGGALIGAAVRDTAQEQRQAQYERENEIQRAEMMAYHQKMADSYQRTGRGWNQKWNHLKSVKRWQRRKWKKHRFYSRGEGIIRAISNRAKFQKRKFWQDYRSQRDWGKGYQARRHDEAQARMQWGGGGNQWINDYI